MMFVAEVLVLTENGYLATSHRARFSTVASAKAEYTRVKDLFDQYEKRANAVPSIVEMIGDDGVVTFVLRNVSAVSMADYAAIDAGAEGFKEAYPNLFPPKEDVA